MKLPRPFFAPLAIGAPAAAARTAGAARAHDPFRAAAYREGAREGAASSSGRSTWCSAIWKTRSRSTPRRPRATASSPWRKATDFGATGLWTRINALNSPWALDDVIEIVGAVGDKLDVIMLPKVEGPWDIHYLDQLLAQLEARHAIKKPILIHAILETAQGVNNVEAIATASPRMHGMSLGRPISPPRAR